MKECGTRDLQQTLPDLQQIREEVLATGTQAPTTSETKDFTNFLLKTRQGKLSKNKTLTVRSIVDILQKFYMGFIWMTGTVVDKVDRDYVYTVKLHLSRLYRHVLTCPVGEETP